MAEFRQYAAFISYSSKDDAFARKLHRALEHYAIPRSLGRLELTKGGKPNRIFPVCRDREELGAGDVNERIQAALRASRFLIVVCSPNAAKSPWVQNEIEYFAGLGRYDSIFAIIADTAPVQDSKGADATSSCFPPAFRSGIGVNGKLEPVAGDARNGKDGFRNAWLKIVAGMVGVALGQLLDRDKRSRQQRIWRSAGVWSLVAVGFALAFITQGAWMPKLMSYWNFERVTHSQTELAAAAVGTVFQDCATGSSNCPEMVVLPAGDFLMGSAENDAEAQYDEQRLRKLHAAALAVSKYEITIANWDACVGAGGCTGNLQPSKHPGADGNYPVMSVSWDDAQEYVAWLSKMTGQRYRLLTEAEWEYAARAGAPATPESHTRFGWGNADPICVRTAQNGMIADHCAAGPLAVGTFQPNAFGLYDMHGNAQEWVEDCHDLYDRGKVTAEAIEYAADLDPCDRVMRGGAWGFNPWSTRSAYRNHGFHSARFSDAGFRVARSLSDH